MKSFKRATILLAAVSLGIIAVLTAIVMLMSAALGQHMHGNEMIPKARGEFYSTWMRPDMPNSSCCNQNDCSPAEARTRNGVLEARQIRPDGYGPWLVVPPEKVEQERDSPDGLNHLCAIGSSVLCFKAGGGG
jgi:hypothetical protein